MNIHGLYPSTQTQGRSSTSQGLFPGEGHRLGARTVTIEKPHIIASLDDCLSAYLKLNEILDDEKFQGMGDPLSKRIYDWHSQCSRISTNLPPDEMFARMRSFYQELRDKVLVSRINPEKVPIRLKETMICGDLTVLSVKGPLRDDIPENITDKPLIWEKRVLEIFQEAHEKFFKGKEGILTFEVKKHDYASKVIAWVNNVQFDDADPNEGMTELSEDANTLLEEMKDIGSSQEALDDEETRSLVICMLTMSNAIKADALLEYEHGKERKWRKRVTVREQEAQELKRLTEEGEIRALKVLLETKVGMRKMAEETKSSHKKVQEILEDELHRVIGETEAIYHEQELIKEELPTLMEEGSRLERQIRAANEELERRRAECNRIREEQRNAQYSLRGLCLIL